MADATVKSAPVGRPRITASDARVTYALERLPEQLATAKSHLRVLKAAAGDNDDAGYFAAEASSALDAAEAAFKALSAALKPKA
jgi:hypothetical protein